MSFTPSNYFALVDCNNFYVSCERLFNPSLEKKPVLVLSANEGCIIARSNEAKVLGFPMGAPVFMWKDLILLHNVQCLASNFSLYGDISQRIMEIIQEHFCDTQIYSIDEAFIPLETLSLKALYHLQRTLKKWVGISASIGVAPTMTLAKAANFLAKKNRVPLFQITPPYEESLKKIAVRTIWGIGHASSEILKRYQVETAWDLTQCSNLFIEKHLKSRGLQIATELRGTPCLQLEERSSRKSVVTSRSFREAITSFLNLRASLAQFVEIAAEKLRSSELKARFMTVFATVEGNSLSYSMKIEASNSTSYLIKKAFELLASLYSEGKKCKRVGVMLQDLSDGQQLTFWPPANPKEEIVMKTIDHINRVYGKRAVFFASAGALPLETRTHSLCYTTRWDEILTIRLPTKKR